MRRPYGNATLPGPWVNQAACKGAETDLFYPGAGDLAIEAQAMCAKCPVITECLEHGTTYERYGIWGGIGERPRSRTRKNAQ